MTYRFGSTELAVAARRVVPILVLVLVAVPAAAALLEVAENFSAGNYPGARTLLEGAQQGARPAEEILWRSRLLADPEQALALLQEAQQNSNLPEKVRIRVALEIAELEGARGRYEAALRSLNPIFLGDPADLPGEVYLQAGLAYRALGNLQKAREMLASVRPDDPAFILARGSLGEIGLQQDDSALALRSFQSALARDPGDAELTLAAGLWEALRRTDEHEQADRLVQQLRHQHPGSLALLEIDRVLRTEKEELAARAVGKPAPVDSVLNRVENLAGRFCLQLGAFSDRGLALEFQRRFLNQVPDLHIEQVRDDRGQFLYKIRSGSFVNPARASSEADRLGRLLGVEVIVADLAN